MCGIVGWVGVAHPGTVLEDVRAAGRLQRHRGPDDERLLVVAPRHGVRYLEAGSRRTDIAAADPDLPFSAVIAHQRLAILDLRSSGAQPMPSADGLTWLAYNGEIYNHVELRREIEATAGRRFHGHGDTEVLLAAYELWGRACLERLQGMFAFAILDRRRRSVLLARDHLGQKPLFLRPVAGGLVFGSEIPALLRIAPARVRAARHPTLDFLATGRTDHRTETMIEGISRLDPGTAVEIAGPSVNEWTVHRYWSPSSVPERANETGVEESAGALRAIFDRSVTWHRRSDVPVGTLLSGGMDSSAILLAQRRIAGPEAELQAVSYIGGAGAVSEERWIDAVSSAADCGTTKVRLDREVWSEALAAALRQGEPMGGPAILVHHVLCKRARATGVKVLLGGQGADEVLAGYPSALPLRVAGLARQGRLLAATRLVAAAAHGRLPQAAIVMAQVARALTRQRRPLRGWPWLAIETDAVRSAIGGRDRPLTVADLVRDYLLTSLPAILRWEDRNTMAASIEGRLPFLLPELVEFCLALPESHLVGPRGESKYVLRCAVRDLLPAVVRYRHGKVGLSVPVEAWARDIPDVAVRLARAAGISGIVASWVRDRASDLRGGRAISARQLFAIWRLVGLDLWSEALGVEVSL